MMDSTEAFLASLAASIRARYEPSEDVRIAIRFICDALSSWKGKLIQGSHMEARPAAEIAAFLIDSATVQLTANLVSDAAVTRAAETYGSVEGSQVLVRNLKNIMVANDRARQVLDSVGASESTLQ